MTELQREYELANRAEKRNAELQRQKLLKMVCGPGTGAALRCALPACSLHQARQARIISIPVGGFSAVFGMLQMSTPSPSATPPPQTDAKAERAGAKAAKRVGRAKSGREEREEAAKKSAIEELKAARERKARGAEERWVPTHCCCRHACSCLEVRIAAAAFQQWPAPTTRARTEILLL